MNRRHFFTSAFAFSLMSGNVARADSIAKQITQTAIGSLNRNTVHLFGDSIFRGWALGSFPDQQTGSEPLSGFRSISSMANITLAENGMTPAFHYEAGWKEKITIPDLIQKRIEQGDILSGDFILIEDAGPHGSDTAAYKAKMTAAVAAANALANINVIMMTMFDYIEPSNIQLIPDCQYDAVLESGKSMNDVLREVAAEAKGARPVTLIDMNAKMDAWRNKAQADDGVPVMHPDGIHPNVWGQMFMTGQLLKTCGFRPHIQSVRDMETLAIANMDALAYGAEGFTEARVRECVRYCLLA